MFNIIQHAPQALLAPVTWWHQMAFVFDVSTLALTSAMAWCLTLLIIQRVRKRGRSTRATSGRRHRRVSYIAVSPTLMMPTMALFKLPLALVTSSRYKNKICAASVIGDISFCALKWWQSASCARHQAILSARLRYGWAWVAHFRREHHVGPHPFSYREAGDFFGIIVSSRDPASAAQSVGI